MAKLLIYNRQTNRIYCDRFINLTRYLPKNSVLVFNDTKVLPARISVKKETGGKAGIFYLKTDGDLIKAMTDRNLKINSRVYIKAKLYFTVESKEGKYFFLRPSFGAKKIYPVLKKYGTTPIPPYIKNSPLSEQKLREKYQAVFAKIGGAVAAPTASLHFTNRLLKKLKKSGIAVKFLTLHVNLGTFAPLTEGQLESGKLHEEEFLISESAADFLNRAKKGGRKIIAVGTTAARALESAADKKGKLSAGSGKTDIFIKEGHRFKFIDGLITNFHVPKSSLLMLAAALISREKILELYQEAIIKKFKFFSFGDGMLIF